MKLQTKFVLVGGLATAFVATQAAISTINTQKIEDALHTTNIIAEVIQRHMEGDMMHDALRSDVMAATLAAVNADGAGIAQASKDIEEHGAIFIAAFTENQKENLRPDIMKTYGESMDELNAYLAAAKALVAAAQNGEDLGAVSADFDKKFEAMEGSNAALTEEIEHWNDEQEVLGKKLINDTQKISGLLSLLSIIAVLSLPVLCALLIFRPLRRMMDVMAELAKGNYDLTVEGTARKDEVGEMARVVEVFKESGEQRVELEKKQELQRIADRAEDEKRLKRAAATDAFADRMKAIIETVAAAATQMYRSSEAMGYSISSASTRVGNVATASTQTSMNVQSVAAASEELSATVREIAEQISRSSSTVRDAVAQVTQADATALSLDEATKKIGQIVDVIQSIANQINLLALNATIESARAGDAGKGFAVVAGEVKTLATQTSKATDEIASNIASIQEVSSQVISSLQAIKLAITSVDEISAAISAAVEEQNATTDEIASNMTTAASGTAQINDEINQVSVATAESSDSAAQVLDAAKMLSQEAEKLSREMSEFIADMNAA